MLEVKIPVEIKYTDPETRKHITAAKNEISSQGDIDTTFKFRNWDKDYPQVSFIKFYLYCGITIFVDRPCKVNEDGYVVNLEQLVTV